MRIVIAWPNIFLTWPNIVNNGKKCELLWEQLGRATMCSFFLQKIRFYVYLVTIKMMLLVMIMVMIIVMIMVTIVALIKMMIVVMIMVTIMVTIIVMMMVTIIVMAMVIIMVVIMMTTGLQRSRILSKISFARLSFPWNCISSQIVRINEMTLALLQFLKSQQIYQN